MTVTILLWNDCPCFSCQSVLPFATITSNFRIKQSLRNKNNKSFYLWLLHLKKLSRATKDKTTFEGQLIIRNRFGKYHYNISNKGFLENSWKLTVTNLNLDVPVHFNRMKLLIIKNLMITNLTRKFSLAPLDVHFFNVPLKVVSTIKC